MAQFTGIGLASPTSVSDLFASAAPSLPVTSSSPTSSSVEPTSSSSVSTAETSSNTSPLPPSSSTQLINAVNTATSSSSANDTTTSGKSFLQNKPAVIGVFAGVGVLVLLLLVCLVACLGRRRQKRQQQLDREMDASFRETMNHAADTWRHVSSLDPNPSMMGLQKTQSVYSMASEASGSHPAYTQPALPVPQQQQQNYDLGNRQGNASDEWPPASPAVVSLAVRGVVVEPQIVQPRRAQMQSSRGHAHADSPLAQKPSQSAEVGFHSDPQPVPLPTIYLSQSRYTVTPLPMDAAHSTPPPDMPTSPDIATSPDMLTSPLMPITPTPFPNPFDQHQEEGRGQAMQQRLSTGFPLSPLPALPNPYGAD